MQPQPQNHYQPMPYHPPQPRWNSTAILGFIMALCPVTCIAGFVLGIVGVVQCGNAREKGRGLAVAAIFVGAAWVFFGALWLYQAGMMFLDVFEWYMDEPDRFFYSYTMMGID